MPSVYSECLAQFAWAAAEVDEFIPPAVLAHQVNSLEWLDCADQNRFSNSRNTGCHIEAVVYAVDEIYVSQPPALEHDPVPAGSAPEGMACRIILGVSFGLHNNPGDELTVNLPSQKTANKVRGKDCSTSAEKTGRWC